MNYLILPKNEKYHFAIKQLVEYASNIPKSSWQYEAIKQEISKMERLCGFDVVKSFTEDDVVYPELNVQLVKNIWQVAKQEEDFRVFIKKLITKKYIIKQLH